MNRGVRVGIVVERYASPGGIQTCLLELIVGLNEVGIVPEIVWDEPQNWNALGDPPVEATYGGGRLGISSAMLRRLPFWLGGRLRSLSFRTARLDLERYDFVYSFELEVKMASGVPNVCWLTGPSHLRMPGEQVSWRRLGDPDELRKMASLVTSPLVGPDRNATYVTHSEWIADLFHERFGIRAPVIWPPVRSRVLPPAPPDRSGFLFLSRLVASKGADSMLALASAYPDRQITIAGVVLESNRAYADRIRDRVRQQGLRNVRIVENPSEQDVATLLTSHELFVFPAPWEHFGIVTVEAIQAGLLPLVHDTGGQREIVPFDRLRFLSDEELVDRAAFAFSMPVSERRDMMDELQRHVRRGSPERFREEMLRPLRGLV